MRTLLRILLSLLLLLVLFGLLAVVLGPFLVSVNPAPGVADVSSVAAAESRFVRLPTGPDDTQTFHYVARSGPDPKAPQLREPLQQDRRPAFVLLHGFTFNLFTWNQVFETFARYGPVVAYDQLPYGLSAKPVPDPTQGDPDLYSKTAALEQLFALLDALELEQVILVGNSSGGTLALEAALAQPERVAGLILIAPWVHSKRPVLPDWLVELPQMRRISLSLARYLGRHSPLLDYSYAEPARIDEERRAVTGAHRLLAGWDLAWGALLQRSLSDPVTIAERLDEIAQPTLVLTGDADRVVPVSDTVATAEALANASLVTLPDCGHLPQEECPAEVASAVSAWLKARGPVPIPAP
ncbi:MAG: alpha/beta fold hydrolase [Halochromatium sp.]|uniref:alpha/beta fold hydrolase n=1 Tax=Halochromatium sp. TaxID=2049430 RepID=UPI00397D25D6